MIILKMRGIYEDHEFEEIFILSIVFFEMTIFINQKYMKHFLL